MKDVQSVVAYNATTDDKHLALKILFKDGSEEWLVFDVDTAAIMRQRLTHHSFPGEPTSALEPTHTEMQLSVSMDAVNDEVVVTFDCVDGQLFQHGLSIEAAQSLLELLRATLSDPPSSPTVQ